MFPIKQGFITMLIACLSVAGIQPAAIRQIEEAVTVLEEMPAEEPTVTPTDGDPASGAAVAIEYIDVAQAPQTVVYGEKVDKSAFLVNIHFSDGTAQTAVPVSVSVDTSETGYHEVVLAYEGFTTTTQVQVVPRKPYGMYMTDATFTTVRAMWELLAEADGYEVEYRRTVADAWIGMGSVSLNSMEFIDLTQGELNEIRVRAFSNDITISPEGEETPLTSYSEWSDPYTIAPRPNGMTETPVATSITRTKIKLSWSAVYGATGYSVYYRESTQTEFTRSGAVDGKTAYKVTGLKGGLDYYIYVVPYAGDESNPGDISPEAFYGTAPSLPSLTVRGGDKTVRVNYSGGRAAQSLKLYISEEKKGEYTLAHTFEAPVEFKVRSLHKLSNKKTYYVKMIAERTVAGWDLSCETNPVKVTTKKAKATSTKPKYYKKKKNLKNSPAYKNYEDFRKLMNYKKSFAMPGMINTNSGGFDSATMVPQGMTFYGKYILISAYDLKKVNDSVIYVLTKKDRKLQTVLVLPHKGHGGGIASDGTYIWMAHGKKLRCITGATVDQAVKSGARYKEIYSFTSTVTTNQTISYVTCYKGRIWAGAYNELAKEYMYVYERSIVNNVPTLKRTGKMLMPDRTQGVTFTGKGKMIVSRSCQTDSAKRGFMSCLDIYTPEINPDETMKKGEREKSIPMPPMNEEILIDGSYTYVLYESVAMSPPCQAPIDRVIAFKTSKLLKKKKK